MNFDLKENSNVMGNLIIITLNLSNFKLNCGMENNQVSIFGIAYEVCTHKHAPLTN